VEVDSLLVTAEPSQRSATRPLIARLPWREALIILGYVLVAVALTWNLWQHPTRMAPTAVGGNVNMDVYLSTWFMRYVATAISHGHLPALVTMALNAPQGVNAMWNTSLLAPGVLLTPVTLLAGPVASLTLLLTLGFAGSATSMFFVLRRWDASRTAAAIGGAFFGFMPGLVVAAQDHYHLQFAVFAPLIVDAVLSIITGRSRPVRTGLWLGLLLTLQLFTAEEMLVDVMIAGAVLVVVLMLCRPRAIAGRLRASAAGIGTALALTLLLCGRALWVQFHGPLAEHGSPWNVFKYGNPASSFVTAPNSVLWHGNFAQYLLNTGQRPIEVFDYLGWPLQIALIIIPFVFWRDLRIRVAGLSCLVVEWLTMGGRSAWLPWHYLRVLPILNQVIVTRLSILTDGLVAVVLALVLDKVIRAVRERERADWRRPALAAAMAVALAAIAVPLIPRTVPASPVLAPPSGWTTVISRLHIPAGGAVLILPLDGGDEMEWQAATNEPISITTGYCIAPDPTGKATKCGNRPMQTDPERTVALRTNWLANLTGGKAPSVFTMEAAIRQWHPAAVVIVKDPSPDLAAYMLRFFGPPTASADGVLGWRTNVQFYKHLGGRVKALHEAEQLAKAAAAKAKTGTAPHAA
jgi:hypothetical protein